MLAVALAGLALAVLVSAAPLARASSPAVAWAEPEAIDSGAPLPFSGANDIACVDDSFCLAVGAFGMAAGSADPLGGVEAWTAAHVDDAPGNELTAISCPSASFCAAVDRGGNVVTSSDPLAGEGAWKGVHLGGVDHLADISCPSASFCAIVDEAGRAIVSSDPAGGAGSWQATAVTPGRSLKAISCASASFCAAVDFGAPYNSDVLVSTAPGSGQWARAGLDLHGPTNDISCPSPSLCVAVSESGTLVSSEPAAGAAAWEVSSDGAGLGEISCPSVDFCAAAGPGDFAWLTDPAVSIAWNWTDITPVGFASMSGLSCPSADFCAGVEASGDVRLSADPDGGAGAWTLAEIHVWPTGLTSASCPTASFCAVTDEGGGLYVSSAPSSPARWGAWSRVQLDADSLIAVSCASPAFCLAIGLDGKTFASTDPTAGASAWRSLTLATDLHDVSCPSSSFCALVANVTEPEVLISTNPAAVAPDWNATVIPLGEGRLGWRVLGSISCPEAGFCAAAGSEGAVRVSADPSGGVATWISASVGEPFAEHFGERPWVEDVACPTASACGALARTRIATTTDPLGGTAAWRETTVAGSLSAKALACPDTSLCVAVEENGHAISARGLESPTPEWGTADFIDGFGLLRDVSCAPQGALCVAVDDSGYLVVGRANPVEPGGGGAERPAEHSQPPSGKPPASPSPAKRSKRCKPKPKKGKAKHGKSKQGKVKKANASRTKSGKRAKGACKAAKVRRKGHSPSRSR